MEADRLRENPQTPHQQETLQAITQGCTRLMRLLLAANNQATRRRKHKKLPSTSFNWVQAATDMHPACPNKKQNHLQNSLLRRTQFWVRKSFSKPASLKRASLEVHCTSSHQTFTAKESVALAEWLLRRILESPMHTR